MVKVKGVNIFPSQIDELLSGVESASSEFQFMIDHLEGKDICTLFVECKDGANLYSAESEIREKFKAQIGIGVNVKPVAIAISPGAKKRPPGSSTTVINTFLMPKGLS